MMKRRVALDLVALSIVAFLVGGQAVAQGGIGYPTVADARTAATALPGARKSEQQGWLIVEQMPVL